MKLQSALAVLLIVCLGGCATQTPSPAPGSDRDAYGCIASAGYSWCADTNRCERPWELAQKRGLERTKEAFDASCKNPAMKQ